MRGVLAIAVATCLACSRAQAQEFAGTDLQIHGFATQAALHSNNNDNYLGMNTTGLSTGWTEAAVNLNDQVSDKLRVGAQVHLTRLGAFGGDNISVDWAIGEYSFKPWFGIRAGKVKIRWGLFNDTQDADPGYLWCLLPESVYGVDIRATNLAQYGAEAYGRVSLGENFGSLDYSAYYGDYSYATNDGYSASFAQQGIVFTKPASGKTPGLDLRWSTPLRGLKISASLMMYDASGNLVNGTYDQPLAFWPTYYAQYNRNKFFANYQYVKLVQYQTVTFTGTPPSTSAQDTRAWFAMAGYHLTDKLQAGGYYTRYLLADAGDNHDPANYFHDAVLSGRYDVDSHVYLKLEGHIVKGNGLGFYALDNPNGLAPQTNLIAAKVGFTF